MKQFSLEEYTKNPSRKIVTRDGRNVKILCTNHYSACPVIAEVEGSEYSYSFYPDGKFRKIGSEYQENDLFFSSEKKEGWINLYKNEDGISWLCPQPFMSKKEAEKEGKGYTCSVTTIKIEWEE